MNIATKHQVHDILIALAWILFLGFAIIFASGCATQSVEQTLQNGAHTKYHTTAFFNKTAMTGTLLGKETAKTKQLFGQSNSAVETQSEAIQAFFEGMQGMFDAGFKAGAKSVAP